MDGDQRTTTVNIIACQTPTVVIVLSLIDCMLCCPPRNTARTTTGLMPDGSSPTTSQATGAILGCSSWGQRTPGACHDLVNYAVGLFQGDHLSSQHVIRFKHVRNLCFGYYAIKRNDWHFQLYMALTNNIARMIMIKLGTWHQYSSQ